MTTEKTEAMRDAVAALKGHEKGKKTSGPRRFQKHKAELLDRALKACAAHAREKLTKQNRSPDGFAQPADRRSKNVEPGKPV